MTRNDEQKLMKYVTSVYRPAWERAPSGIWQQECLSSEQDCCVLCTHTLQLIYNPF